MRIEKRLFLFVMVVLTLSRLAVFSQNVPPSQHIRYKGQTSVLDTAVIVDSIYAGSYYTSMVSIEYHIYRNGVRMDTVSDYGWADMTMRSMGNDTVAYPFLSGSLNLPQDVSLFGITCSSFSLSIVNASSECNRNRPVKLRMHFGRCGRYDVVLQIYRQTNTTAVGVGTYYCNMAQDYYATNGAKGSLWVSDTITYVVPADTEYHTHFYVDSVCSYFWEDSLYETSGNYERWYVASDGMDSVVHLHLNIRPLPYVQTDTVALCGQASYLWRGHHLTGSGLYADTLARTNGCDSILQLQLTLAFPKTHWEDSVRIYAYELPYRWHHRSLFASGIYRDTLSAASGCDSIVCLSLKVLPVYYHSDSVGICGNELPYRWHSRVLFSDTLCVDTVRYTDSCAVSAFRLFVHPVFSHRDTAYVCASQPYVWHNRIFRSSGDYADSLQTQWGCDSICHLHLQVYPEYVRYDSLQLCESGFPYMWEGLVLDSAGEYSVLRHTRAGCDSLLVLKLTSHKTLMVSVYDTVCAGTAYCQYGFDIAPDATLDADSLVCCDSLVSVYGCDSLSVLHLHLLHLPDTLGAIRGDTLLLTAGSFHFETDSLPGLSSCCWRTDQSEWILNPSGFQVEVEVLQAGRGHLFAKATHVCGETGERSLWLRSVVSVDEATAGESVVKVIPNPFRETFSIQVETEELVRGGVWEMYDVQGCCVRSGRVEELQTGIHAGDLPKGMYFVRIIVLNKDVITLKIIKL